MPLGDPREGYRRASSSSSCTARSCTATGRWCACAASGEKQEPWLLIKERDDEARPLAEYDVVEALPDSVLSGTRRRRPRRRSADGAAAKQTKAAARERGTPAGARKAALPRRARAAARHAGRRAARRRRTTGSTRSSSTATACWRASTAARCSCFTRNGNDWTTKLPQLAKALGRLELALGLARRRDRGAERAAARPTSRRCRTPSTAARTATIVYYAVRPALLRRPRPARGAAGASAARCWHGCSASKPPAALRFSEAFDAAAARPARVRLPAGPRRHHRQAHATRPTCRAARPTGSSSSAASARSS